MKAKVKEYRFEVPKAKDGQVLVVKVGSDERPASREDLLSVMKSLKGLQGKLNGTLVTHHVVSFDLIPAAALENIVVIGNIDVIGSKVG